ncbi:MULTISPECIES: hypothetical protein [unclassified Streptomyces]|uniref:hypothetical protein n=1 Tax=unclassified Streptomyces TaxID=2593676 RepID=UPI000CD546CD|nr:hypothetical protein [Streptomyces sp. SM10]
MTHANGKHADFEGLREKAVALRREGLSVRQIRDRLKVFNNDILNRLLQGEPAPERYWAELTGAAPSAFGKTSLKRHSPKTNRKNTGEGYQGCLVVRVLKGAELYRRVEGAWYGIVLGANRAD